MPLPHSPFVESLLDLLAPLGNVHAKRMFGGYGIYKDSLMFGLVDDERFYLKVDDFNRARFTDNGLEPFRFTDRRGRSMTLSYHLAPESAFNSPIRMKPWALMGWEAAERAALLAATHKRTVAQPSTRGASEQPKPSRG